MNSSSIVEDRPHSWSTAHGHFLQMGGFRLRITICELRDLLRRHESRYSDASVRHSGGDNITSHDLISSALEQDSSDGDHKGAIIERVLNFQDFKQLLAANIIPFPTVTEDEIMNLGKGDTLSKLIALIQLTWFLLQIVMRAVRGIAITELELTTVALIVTNSAMYFFWWSKPVNVGFPVVIQTRGVEKLLSTAPYAKLDYWGMSYEFDIRKHIFASMAYTTQRIFASLKSALREFANLPSHIFTEVTKSPEHLRSLIQYLSSVPSLNNAYLGKLPTGGHESGSLHIEQEGARRKVSLATALRNWEGFLMLKKFSPSIVS